jgi:molybdopterin-guanine dinucleotide biosynthesis protein A
VTSTSADRPWLTRRPARTLIGAVLVGGMSRRMGRDKARIPWRGEPLASRVASRVRAATGHVVLVGGAGRGYDDLGWPWFPDPPALAGSGPMAGLVQALAIAERVLLVACDLPAIEPWFLRRLLELAAGRPAAAPRIAGRLEPLCAVYGRGVLPAAIASLAAGSGKMSDLFATPNALAIPESAWGGAVAHLLHNVNDPSALEP